MKNFSGYILLLSLGCLLMNACVKSGVTAPNPNIAFLGVYNGSDNRGTLIKNLIVDSGASTFTIYIPITFYVDTPLTVQSYVFNSYVYAPGVASCARVANLVGTVNGNNINFASQVIYDACGNKDSIAGSGTLSGNYLSFTLTGVATLLSGYQTLDTIAFSGSK
jgi:hypothetical protein